MFVVFGRHLLILENTKCCLKQILWFVDKKMFLYLLISLSFLNDNSKSNQIGSFEKLNLSYDGKRKKRMI